MIIRACLAPLAFVLSVLPAIGGPSASYTEAWRWAHFTTASGLPSDYVLDAAEAGGRFWAVTRGGVAWFDGYRWQKVAGTPDAIAESGGLVADDRGEIVTVVAGRLFVGSQRGLREVPVSDGGHAVEMLRCARAASGPVLVASADTHAIYEWNGTTCRPHEASRVLGQVFALVGARPASAWASAERGLWRWDGAAWSLRLQSEGERLGLSEAAEQPGQEAVAVVQSPVDWRGLWRWERSSGPREVRGLFAAPIVSATVGSDGDIVVTHHSGEVVHATAGGWEMILPGPLPLDARKVGFLQNHDLWVASDHGLFVYRRSADRCRVQAIPRPDDRNTINDIIRTPDGRILLATGRGILADSGGVRPDEGAWRATQELGPLTGLAVDGRGRLWAASGYNFTGLRRRDETGAWTRPVLHASLDASYVHRIARDRSGALWFLALAPTDAEPGRPETGGAYRLLADDRVQRWSTGEGLPSPRVYAFAEGPDGAYWFGTGKGISRWRAGQWRHWTIANGLKGDRVFTLAVDAQGVTWFGHQGSGLGRIEHDRVTYVTTADGLTTDEIWSVLVDDRGRVWAAGDGGVSVLKQGVWTSFDVRSGLTSTRIWPVLSFNDLVYLGTRGGGLVVLNLRDESAPPSIVVPQAPVVDERRFSIRWQAFAWWGDLPPEAVLTRARIDNGPWTRWSTDRELNADGLSAGQHRVSFESRDVFGVVNRAIPAVVVSVPPPLIARPAFFVPVGALALVALGLVGVLSWRQRQHHLELHRREEQFIRTFHASPLAASITALEDGRFLEVNDALERLAGCSRKELVGHIAEQIGFSAENYDRRETAKAIETGAALRGIPLTTRRRTGERLELVGYFQAIEFDGRPAILGQYLDATDQHRLEEQLRQAQKMESVGRLAGGVAHDFNNLLTVIIGNAALVDADLPPGDPRRDGIEQITIAADRAERLTRQLLAFARRQVVEPKVVHLNDLVLGTDRLLRRLIGEDIELVTIPGADLPPVFVDPNQMEQVIWNMAVNARDAMPGGGTLTIRTSAVTAAAGEGRDQREAVRDLFVRLSISDTGLGMDASVRSRLFEPFFTTKDPGKGTGLGLATCYGIVTQAGGRILVESQPGQGTTFHVDLPSAPAGRQGDEARERAVEIPGGAETILLAEDEVQVRKLAAAVLRQRGYHVLEAENGQEALQLSDRYQGRIDLLITDVVMPLMRGTELAERMRALRAGLRVLFVSGYADNDAFRHEAGTERVAFLGKPFTPAALARRVRDLLDESDLTSVSRG